MKKKRVSKRAAKKSVRTLLRVTPATTTSVTITLPNHLYAFLRGASERTALPVETLVRALLAVQVHAMCERAAGPGAAP